MNQRKRVGLHGEEAVKAKYPLLLRAAVILRTRGWVRGFYQLPRGFCAMGAIQEARKSPPPTEEARALSTALRRDYARTLGESSISRSICAFNDTIARDKDEVIEALERVGLYGEEARLSPRENTLLDE